MLASRRLYIEGKDYICLCGCAQSIILTSRYKNDGVPKYIVYHHNRGKKKTDLELIGTGKKRCPTCMSIKNNDDFYKDATKVDGYRCRCKACCAAAGKLYRKNNPEKCAEYLINWRKNNPDKNREINNNWTKNNPEKVREKSKRYRLKYPTKQKEKDLKYKYGLTLKDYAILVDEHKGHCGICGVHETEIVSKKTKLCIDHDHSTGKVRGLLCHSCNKLLGNAKDNQQILLNAIQYLINNEGILDE